MKGVKLDEVVKGGQVKAEGSLGIEKRRRPAPRRKEIMKGVVKESEPDRLRRSSSGSQDLYIVQTNISSVKAVLVADAGS